MMKKVLPSFLKWRGDDKSRGWGWATCREARTVSFRSSPAGAEESSDWFTQSSESSGSVSTAWDEPIERMIGGLRGSERLRFEPAGKSRSMVEEEGSGLDPGGARVVSMDSADPVGDFRKSMEEMVEAHGMKGWEPLEELLSCYLRLNATNNHPFILAAFLHLFITLSISSPSSSSSIQDEHHHPHLLP